jgi:hypothetical protein
MAAEILGEHQGALSKDFRDSSRFVKTGERAKWMISLFRTLGSELLHWKSTTLICSITRATATIEAVTTGNIPTAIRHDEG